MINENLEGIKEFFIPKNIWKNRSPGLSAMMRVGDEEDFIVESISSVLDFFDEIVVVLNNPKDNTENLVKSIKSDKIKIYKYPFDLFPNGPGHDKFPNNSVKEISYYYNWCLSKTTKTHVCKWDGDMIALPNFCDLRKISLKSKLVQFHGLNIVNENLDYLSKDKEVAASETRIFKVTEDTFYIQGKACEIFSIDCHKGRFVDIRKNTKRYVEKKPVYLHYKHSKSLMGTTKVWPKNWQEDPHFIKIYNRKSSGKKYTGIQPRVIFEKIKNNLYSKYKYKKNKKIEIYLENLYLSHLKKIKLQKFDKSNFNKIEIKIILKISKILGVLNE